ncbi:MAG: DUF945 family protein [Pseudomonadota bacterium]
MRIKAKYVVAVVLIIVAVLAAPFVDGFFFKQNYYKMIAARHASGAPINIVEYHLGWLSSTAKLEIASGNNPKAKITIDQVIQHGPIIADPDTHNHKFAEATIASHIHLDKQFENYLLGGANSDSGVMGIFTWVSFLQNYQSHFQSAAFLIKVPGQQDSKITWTGMSGDIETVFKHNFELENFKTSLVGGPLYIQNAEHGVQISAQQIDGEGNCGKYVVCVGTTLLNIPLINISSASQVVRLTGLSYGVNSSVDAKNNLSGTLALTFTKYEAQDYNAGPGTFKLTINSVNTVALKKVMEAVHDASANLEKQSDPQATQLMLLAQLTAAAPHLITPTFSINESSMINTSYGPFSSSALLAWPEKNPLPNSINDLMQMNFKLHVTAATALVDQIIMYIDQKTAERQSASTMPTPISSTSTTGKPESFDEMLEPLAAQGLTADEIKNIVSLQQKNIPADAFNSYIDGRVAIRMIPATLAPILKRDYLTALNTPFQNVAANAGANKQLDVWVRENKITSDTRAALILLQKQGFSSEIYNSSIDDIVAAKRLPSDLGDQLKSQYASTNPESSFGGGDDTIHVAASNVAAQDQGEARKKFDAEIQQGFIKQVKDSYVIDIDYEHGELKVNGKAVPIPNPF